MMRETTIAESASRVRGRTTAKSSPPRRPATSRRRSVSRRAVPIWRSASSPVGWPSSSLTRCMRSTSKTISVAASRAASTARSASSWKWAPVRQPGQGVDVDEVAELALRREEVGDAPLVVHDQRELGHQERDHRRRQQRAQGGVGDRHQRAQVGERRRPARRAGRCAAATRPRRTRARSSWCEVLEAADRGGDVQRQAERRHRVDLRIAHRQDRLDPGADRQDHRDDEDDPVRPFGDPRPAARVEAAHAAEHDDRPLQGEHGGDRRADRGRVGAGLKRQRGSEDGVGDDPPARAAPALLLEADRHGRGAREHEDERERDEQGRRMQEHAQILGSGACAHGALSAARPSCCGENVTNWQGRMHARAARAARSLV